MNFPLSLHFKFFALAPQIYVTDATGRQVFYIRQKLFKLREAVNVFRDQSQSEQVATIKADRIIDWSAKYGFLDADGTLLGGVGRKGFRSIWRAHYDVFGPNMAPSATIREENPFVKIWDGILSEVPVLGAFTGYLFHPHYLLTSADGTPMLRLKKKGAFLESLFEIEQLNATSDEETRRNVLALLMLVLLERRRG
jgi:uncharacterized protein YxjI